MKSFLVQIVSLIHDRTGRILGLNSAGHTKKLIKQMLPNSDSPVVFDVGANRGEFTDLILQVFPKAKVYIFEPQPEMARELIHRYRDFDVMVNSIALSNFVGESKFIRQRQGDPKGHLITTGEPEGILVQVTTLDEFLNQEKIQHVDLLKIDTEGFDFNVLMGAVGALRGGRIFGICFEVMYRLLMQGFKPSEPQEFLMKNGFDRFYRTSPYLGLIPLKGLIPSYEMKTQNIYTHRVLS